MITLITLLYLVNMYIGVLVHLLNVVIHSHLYFNDCVTCMGLASLILAFFCIESDFKLIVLLFVGFINVYANGVMIKRF